MATNENGVGRLGLWLTIFVSAGIMLSIIGSIFYVAFAVKKNGDDIIYLQARDGKISILESEIAGLKRDLNEIETQFCEADHLRNLTHANDLRWFSMLWQKSYGERLPTDNVYYPIVCNRKIK